MPIVQVSPGRDGLIKQVIMVDPLEAKRMAAKEMEKIKAKEKFKVKEVIIINDAKLVYKQYGYFPQDLFGEENDGK